ncbi:MAG: hypothetical protein AVDCRST_MAG74-1996 [uncultured Pyrinomonadaceae bacterium]|uniref:Uncharacterized protein n=1 Tax=uncultured Pyrinomonadaceae bacterium TaxID=2283094 RepID=A0A6J4NWC3_9BACT|nr:MAG: hypothetical protein AVDCRST_MAG74-1996 [uncultured Pyrinomonadaceae bacterium]
MLWMSLFSREEEMRQKGKRVKISHGRATVKAILDFRF